MLLDTTTNIGKIMKERLKPKNKLRVYWSEKEKDVMFYHPKQRVDGHLLNHYFSYVKYDTGGGETTFVEELERRGFDISTIRFSIAYKK